MEGINVYSLVMIAEQTGRFGCFALMPDARLEKPYDGAKVDDREFLKRLFEAMYEELTASKKKK